MSPRLVYLAGPVELKDTWRHWAMMQLSAAGFNTLDPMRGEECKKVGKHIESNVSDDLIVHRDLNDLQRVRASGGLCLMNLSTTDEGRRPMGTLFELMWCYDHQVPVVAVVGKKCDPNVRTHPWVRHMIAYPGTSVTDAVTLIKTYFT